MRRFILLLTLFSLLTLPLSAGNDVFVSQYTVKPPPAAVISSGSPLASRLVMSLDFRESGGILTYDGASPNRKGTLDTSTATTWSSGKNGISLLKNSTPGGGYITISPVLPAFTSPFTIETLVFINTINTVNMIIGSNSGFEGLFLHSGKIDFNTGGVDNDGTATLVAHKWYHIVVTYAGGSAMTYYLNGVVDATPAATTSSSNGANIFSFPSDGSRSLTGKMEYIRYWSRPLTAGEVWILYTNPYVLYAGTPNIASRLPGTPPTGCVNRTILLGAGC